MFIVDETARAASLSCPAAIEMLEEGCIVTAADPNLISLVLSDISAQLASNLPPEKVIFCFICFAKKIKTSFLIR